MKLHVTAGPDKGQAFPLEPGTPLQAGRSHATSLRLTDAGVSRVHFEIEWDEGHPVLFDCSSVGTLVNGARVERHPLQPGDVIRLGNTELVYADQLPAAAPATPLDPDLARPPLFESLDDLVGKTLSHFMLEAVAGRGTSGHVFRARNVRDGRVVALKVLRPELCGDDEQMQRFVRAMKTMMPLRHPNIIAIRGAGKIGVYCWIAMDYVAGASLTHVLEKADDAGRLPWPQVLRLMADVARALEYAHARAILHRNVTPGNILLRTADRVAMLGDLMLVKALEGDHAQAITRPGVLVGDVAYLAPERTVAGDLDGRADLYGLGATAYVALTGQPPFRAGSLNELVQQIRSAEPERPQRYQPAVPDALQAAVLRLLAKRPEDRFQNGTDLLAELDRIGRMADKSV